MPSPATKRAAISVADFAEPIARRTEKVIPRSSNGVLNIHAPLAVIAPELIPKDPKPWKHPKRTSQLHSHRSGRGDYGRMRRRSKNAVSDVELEWDDEVDSHCGDVELEAERGIQCAEELPCGRREVCIMDIATTAKVPRRGRSTGTWEIVASARSEAADEELEWVHIDGDGLEGGC